MKERKDMRRFIPKAVRLTMATGIVASATMLAWHYDRSEDTLPEPTPIATGTPMPPEEMPTLVFGTQTSCAANLCTAFSTDVNRDTIVDTRDLRGVAACLNKPATQCRDADADINKDGEIDIVDIACIGRNFSSPTPISTPIATPTSEPTLTLVPTPTLTPTQEPTFTPTPEVVDKDINFVFGEGVSLQEQQEIKSGMVMVKDWLSAKTRVEINDLHVFASGNAVWVIDQYLGRTIFPQERDEAQRRLANATAFVGEQRDIFISTSSPGWTRTSPIIGGPVPEGRIHTLLHEYFHILQREVEGYNGIFPHWLNEGNAHFVAAVGLDENKIYPYKKIRQGHVGEAASVEEDLRSMESAQGFYSAGSPFADEYSLAFLAVEFLPKGSPDDGIPALVSFWKHIGEGIPWQIAFEFSFGKTPDQFYNEFESWRQRGFQQ